MPIKREELVALGEVQSFVSGEVLAAVKAAMRCRRAVVVRFAKNGNPYFYARVPLPRAVAQVVAEQQPSSQEQQQ